MRRFKGLSQEELAERVNATRNQIANLEAMRVPLKMVLGLYICKALDVNPNWVFRGSGPQSPMIETRNPLVWELLSDVSQDELFSRFWQDALPSMVTAMGVDVIVKYFRAVSLKEGLSEAAFKKDLTIVSVLDNNQEVKPKLPSLLERLKKATAQRGIKSELAKFLGVSLVQVSQWLSGDREPGGETTLRLLHWVEQQERQK